VTDRRLRESLFFCLLLILRMPVLIRPGLVLWRGQVGRGLPTRFFTFVDLMKESRGLSRCVLSMVHARFRHCRRACEASVAVAVGLSAANQCGGLFFCLSHRLVAGRGLRSIPLSLSTTAIDRSYGTTRAATLAEDER
jgi:hypothetical protein